MDALSHAIECFTSEYHQPFNDAVALHAIELCARWLPVAVEQGRNLEARTAMAHAATLGGMAYGTESAGAAHAMSQSAGGVHDCSHGALTARLLAPVCEFNAPSAPERYARVAQALGVPTVEAQRTSGPDEASRARGSARSDALETALAGVEALYRLTDRVGIPTMVELGFTEAEIPMLARIAFEDPQTIGNPRELGVAEYETIYRTAFARPE
jgi:choline dehydrogenase